MQTIKSFARLFQNELYFTGFADYFRAVERAESKQEMIKALVFIDGFAQAGRLACNPTGNNPSDKHFNINHVVATTAALLSLQVEEDCPESQTAQRICEQTRLKLHEYER